MYYIYLPYLIILNHSHLNYRYYIKFKEDFALTKIQF